MAKAKEYIGLWTKQDKNGNPFLSGSTDSTVFFVFRDKDDHSKKTLHTLDKSVEGAKLEKVGVLENGSGDNGDYQRLGNTFIFKNTRREKETHPDFNMVVYEEESN
jgi:hypothetical protein